MWYAIGNQCFDNDENRENNETEEIGLVTPTHVLTVDMIGAHFVRHMPILELFSGA